MIQGKSLAQARRRLNLTQEDLAKMLDIGLRTLKRYEATTCPTVVWLAVRGIEWKAVTAGAS